MIEKNKLIEESVDNLTKSMLESYKNGNELEIFSTSNFATPTSVYALLKTIETIAENESIPNDNLSGLLHSTIDLISKLKEKPDNYIDEDNIEDSILASLLEKTGLAYPDNSKLDKPSLFEIAFKDDNELKLISERLLDNALDLSFRDNVESEINDHRKLNADALLNISQVLLEEKNFDKLTSLYVDSKKEKDTDFEYKIYGSLFSLNEDVKDKDKIKELGLTDDQVKRLDSFINKIIDKKDLDIEKLEKYKDEYATVNFISFHYTEDVLKKLLKEERELNNGVWSQNPYNSNIQEQSDLDKEEEERLKQYYIDHNQRYLDFLEKNNLFILNSSQKIRNKIPGVPISLIPGAPIGVGLGAIGSNLLGSSIVNEDNVCLFNVSPLTGTIKFTTPGESSKTSYIVAALAARKNGWSTVHLNYNGNEQAAISFFQNSIDSLVKYGGYSYDEIQLPRKYMPILEAMKMKGGEFSNSPIENIDIKEENIVSNKPIQNNKKVEEDLSEKSPKDNKPLKENITNEQEEALSSFSEDLFSDLDAFRNELESESPNIKFKDITEDKITSEQKSIIIDLMNKIIHSNNSNEELENSYKFANYVTNLGLKENKNSSEIKVCLNDALNIVTNTENADFISEVKDLFEKNNNTSEEKNDLFIEDFRNQLSIIKDKYLNIGKTSDNNVQVLEEDFFNDNDFDMIGYNPDLEEYLNSVDQQIEANQNKNRNKKDTRNRPI